MAIRNGMRPVHPGEFLRDEMEAASVSEGALSKALDVPLDRVTMILEGLQGVTADTALRLARYFGTTPRLWLNLQQTWELRRAEIKVGPQIAKKVTPRKSAA
ncbi:MAG: HigA family addiction module antitoxin [Gammaproteobacteria bacterium]|nr:HigA family addiction module antitoxin [Gammaproteobacteria bacterium]